MLPVPSGSETRYSLRPKSNSENKLPMTSATSSSQGGARNATEELCRFVERYQDTAPKLAGIVPALSNPRRASERLCRNPCHIAMMTGNTFAHVATTLRPVFVEPVAKRLFIFGYWDSGRPCCGRELFRQGLRIPATGGSFSGPDRVSSSRG